MHPNLSPHLHTTECNEKIQALLQCRLKNRFRQYFGACNKEDSEMNDCFRKELKERRLRNHRLAEERNKARTKVDLGEWNWKAEQDSTRKDS